ncbi:zinc ABC transporter substrate-binding protein [Spirochaetota bacterium]
MKKPVLTFVSILLLGSSLFYSCSGKEAKDVKPGVIVSILPQAYFAERLAGERLNVSVLVGPGQSPHSWEPSPRQMAELAGASIWFTIGVEFEKALKPKAASLYKNLKISDTTAGINYRMLEAHAHEDGEEEESGPDQHIWLGREQVKTVTNNMYKAIVAMDPSGEAVYRSNKEQFIKDIDNIFDKMSQQLEPLRGSSAFVFHPAFGYLLDDLGLKQQAVEIGGKEPTQKTLATLIEKARAEKARVIFVQAQFPAGAAKAVANAIDGTVVSIDPLARDWLHNLEHIALELDKGLK